MRKSPSANKKTRLIRIVLGPLFILAVPVWLWVGLPEVFEIESDFTQELTVDSYDNFYDNEHNIYTGEQRSRTKFSYTVLGGDSETLDIKNSFAVETLSGEPIFEVSRQYAVDAHSGRHVLGGDRLREGYLFAPRMKGVLAQVPAKSPFTYWHVNYDEPIRMEYRGEANLYGLDVYRYESNFVANQTKELSGTLPGVGEDTGIVLDVHMEVWVEPYTGRIVQYEDAAEALYYDLDTADRLYPWNKFRNRTSNVSAAAFSDELKIQVMKIIVYQYVVPVVLLLIAFMILLQPSFKRWFMNREKRKITKVDTIVLPVASALIVVALSLVLAFIVSNILEQQRLSEFQREVTRIEDSIQDRFEIYANVLRSGRGLFDASENVERDEWFAFINSINLPKSYPGIQGVGFAQYLETVEDVDVFESLVREEGYSDFSVTPPGTRDEYTSILFLEPFDERNQRAFGYDMFSQETRRKGMEFARDSGGIGMTGKVILLQETDVDIQAGFLMYEPVYKPVARYDSVEERRSSLYGYVYAPFRMANFMTGIFVDTETPLGVEIFDGPLSGTLDEENFMYKNDLVPGQPDISVARTLSLFNHAWTVVYTASHEFGLGPVSGSLPTLMIVMSLIFGFLAYTFVREINTRRIRALELAGKMTEELHNKVKQLVAKEDELEEAQKIGKFGNFVWNLKTEDVYWSDESFIIHGWKPAEDNTPPPLPEYMKIIHPDDRKGAKVSMTKAIKKAGDNEYIYRVVWPDSSIHFVRVKSILSFDDSGKPEILQGTFQDVTEEREIDQAKTEFVSLASHQLRTPLTSINWYTEMLLSGDAGKLTKQQREFLQQVYGGGQRMTDLVNSLLNVSRVELGAFAVDPEPLSLKKIVQDAVSDLKPMIKEKKIKLKETYEPRMKKYSGDRRLLGIIFQNLLSNAVKYTPEKGTIELTLETHPKKKNILLTLSDTGYGIPKAEQKKIFSKLYRADNVKEIDSSGTGLGLYIVKAIMDTVGGKIWFESEEGKGTIFFVELPLSGMKAKEGSRPLE